MQFIHSFFTALIVLSAHVANASPVKRASTTSVLAQSTVSTYKPYTYYASTGYCSASSTLTWSCGTNCEANPTFKPIASGGNGDSVQYCKQVSDV